MAAGSIVLASGKSSRQVKRSYRRYKRSKLATLSTVKRLITLNSNKVIAQATVSGGAIPTTGLIGALGVSPFATEIEPLSYKMRGSITNVTNANNIVRVIIFQWKDTSTPTAGTVLYGLTPFSNYDQEGKYLHVLSDRTYSMNLFDKSTVILNYNFGKKQLLRPKVDSNNSTVQNKLWYLMVSNVDTNTTLSTMNESVKYYEI